MSDVGKNTLSKPAKPKSKRGLGTGINILIPQGVEASRPGRAGVDRVPIGAIEVNPEQPRRRFDEAALTELSASIE